jgi:hypothetical protein
LEGESFDVPIADKQILKLWNTRRPDRNTYDDSGPAKLRLTLYVNGKERPYVLPVLMGSYLHGNTYYRNLVGSEVFG